MAQAVQKESDSKLSTSYFTCKARISDNTSSKVQVLRSQTSYNARITRSVMRTLSVADWEKLQADREKNWHLWSLRGEGEV